MRFTRRTLDVPSLDAAGSCLLSLHWLKVQAVPAAVGVEGWEWRIKARHTAGLGRGVRGHRVRDASSVRPWRLALVWISRMPVGSACSGGLLRDTDLVRQE
jgi:hypothetical protein